jgi:hypothetical protein
MSILPPALFSSGACPLATVMPTGIPPGGNAQKRPVLLAEINFAQKRRSRKACCDLRSKEIFRQRFSGAMSHQIVGGS